VKCPKCSYLGFETGDRCKNCGYDFSLLSEAETAVDPDLDLELALRASDDTLPTSVLWNDNFESALAPSPATLDIASPATEPSPPPPRQARPRVDRKLPLFSPATLADDSDEPLIKLPVAPRAPLAVRRTPDSPRLRAAPRPVPKPSRPIEASPTLNFVEEPPAAVELIAETRARTASRLATRSAPPAAVSGSVARLMAAVIDHAVLGAMDLAVVYFTLRMTDLTMAEFSSVPVAPLLAFLLLVKLSYFAAFTAVGGQTIGKMATHIRVVTAENEMVHGSVAIKRTLAGAASVALLGLGFLPALVGPEHRALHDRLTRTRVVALPSA
jgi:uncharacterized RDD family membrane protein YckC